MTSLPQAIQQLLQFLLLACLLAHLIDILILPCALAELHGPVAHILAIHLAQSFCHVIRIGKADKTIPPALASAAGGKRLADPTAGSGFQVALETPDS